MSKIFFKAEYDTFIGRQTTNYIIITKKIDLYIMIFQGRTPLHTFMQYSNNTVSTLNLEHVPQFRHRKSA